MMMSRLLWMLRVNGKLRCTTAPGVASLGLTEGVRCMHLTGATAMSQSGETKQEDADGIQKNPFYAKYADKLKHLQESQPDEFERKLEEMKTSRKEREQQEAASMAEQKMGAHVQQGKARASKLAGQVKTKTIDSVMKVELIKEKSADEIEQIWKEYFSQKQCIYATIKADEYDEVYAKAQLYGTFLYILPKADGYEFYVGQFAEHECHFTPLINFQTYKENAPSCLTMIHYTDLKETKGIVLMQGEVDTKIISVEEAVLLARQMQLYYGTDSGSRFNLVRQLNTQPDTFKHSDIIDEFNRINTVNL